ncbi:MAG TPA: hypothetical protein VLJ11_17955 [Bryobacteraceae bacterium]|nr:hypothetical protein [Bryobacteraceae bacterium]
MSNNQLSPAALLSVVLAGGLALHVTLGPFGWLQTLVGLTLFAILFAYDESQRTATQSIAFGAVCGFCLMLVSCGFLSRWAAQPGTVQVAVPGGWLSVVWVGGALLFFFVDLVRGGNRTPVPIGRAVPDSASQFGRAPIVAAPPPFVPTASARPEPTPEPVTVPNSPETATGQPVPVSSQPPVPAANTPPPKQTLIYVNLLGEGLNMMRAVLSHDLGRGYYLIVEQMPEEEQWEFQTGQVVRCEKKKLASGKHLVAVAEAPRA